MSTLKSPLFFCVTLIILNMLDVITTLYGLSIGGKELNPLFSYQSVPLKITLPFIYMVFFCMAYAYCGMSDFSLGIQILNLNIRALNVLYLIIVTWNVTQIIMRG